jgi:hypothetical protein
MTGVDLFGIPNGLHGVELDVVIHPISTQANCDAESTQIFSERIQNESESRCSQCIHLVSACGEANGMLSVNRADVLAMQQWFRIQVRSSFGVRDRANCDAEPT